MKIKIAIIAMAMLFPLSAATAQRDIFSFEVGETHPAYSLTRLSSYLPRPDDAGNGVVSGSRAGLTPGDRFPALIQSSVAFKLESGYFTSHINDNESLRVWGFKAGEGTPSIWEGQGQASFYATFVMSTDAPLFVQFDWSELVLVAFDGVGGTPHFSRDIGGGSSFFIDDLSVTIEPEPSSLSLVAIGLLGLLLKKRRQLV